VGGSQIPVMAIPDFRGAGDAQSHMSTFNETLWSDISSSGRIKMAPKAMYPLNVPQQASDLTVPPPKPQTPRGRSGEMVQLPTGGGRWLTDWSGPPVSANYLAFGYTAVQNGVLVLRGWLFDVTRDVPANSKMLEKSYLGSPDEAGARKVA